jgi:chemotaxis protein histidine kinase CheA/ActR/RegA family two-component response regulator
MNSSKEWDIAMQPEQQQRIMGYFIEEAKDHLNTIEQGLLSLQSTIDDPEMINEMFRAAHSVKGGAAMLGLNGIQQVSHRLEDFFKVLKESAMRVDQRMESAFLQVFDALKELVEQLQSPFGLTEESAKATLAGVEPVFVELEQRFNLQASNASGSVVDQPPQVAAASRGVVQIFREDVPAQLREMLKLFKQPDTDTASRQQLQGICDRLLAIGSQNALPTWCSLIESAKQAIAASENSYRALAPVVIKDIKQAQELILANQASSISATPQLLALIPATASHGLVEPDFGDIFSGIDDAVDLDLGGLDVADLSDTGPALDADLGFGDTGLSDTTEFSLNGDLSGLDDGLNGVALEASADYDGDGPEVGIEELNTLADLFEGEMPDLSGSWQEEELLGDSMEGLAFDAAALTDLDEGGDFSDLLFETSGSTGAQSNSEDDLNDLFGDVLEDEVPDSVNKALMDAPLDFGNVAEEDELSEFLSISSSNDAAVNEGADPGLEDLFDGLGNEALESDDSSEPSFGSKALDNDDFALNASGEGDLDLDMLAMDDLDMGDLGTDDLDMGGLGDDFDMDGLGADELGIDELDAGEIGRSDLDMDDLGMNSLGMGDLGMGDLGMGDLGMGDLGMGDLGMNDLDIGSPDLGDLGMGSPDLSRVDDELGSDDLSFDLGADALDLGDLSIESEPEDSDAFALDFDGGDDLNSVVPDSPLEDASFSGNASGGDDADLDFSSLDNEFQSADLDLGLGLEEDDDLDLGDFNSASALDSLDLEGFEIADEAPDALDFGTDVESSAEGVTNWDSAESTDLDFDALDLSLEGTNSDALTGAPISMGDVSEVADPWAEAAESSTDLNNTLVAESEGTAGDEALDLGDAPWENSPISGDPSDESSTELAFGDFGPLDAADESDMGAFGFDAPDLELSDLELSDLELSDLDLPDLEPSNLRVTEDETSNDGGLLGLEALDGSTLDFPEPAIPDGTFIQSGVPDPWGDNPVNGIDDLGLGATADTGSFDLGFDDLSATADTGSFDLGFDAMAMDDDPMSSADVGSADESLAFDDDLFGEPATADSGVGTNDSEPAMALDELGEFDGLLGNDLLDNELLGDDLLSDDLLSDDLLSDDLLSGGSGNFGNESNGLEFDDLDDLLMDGAPDEGADFGSDLGLLGGVFAAGAVAAGAAGGMAVASVAGSAGETADDQDFSDLDALLGGDSSDDEVVGEIGANGTGTSVTAGRESSGFDELDDLLKDAEERMGGTPTTKSGRTLAPRATRPGRGFSEQTMRVPIKHLDNLSNLVGELVVNRNSLEQDQERLRQSLDNLLYQVQQLSDVGQRMQDLYERSLLESSLLASRQNQRAVSFNVNVRESATQTASTNGMEYDPLEMDRFTGFHSLSQEMIELIVRVRESSSDIEFIVDETDQVTRMFRQVTTQLQEGLTRSRMVPFAQTADRLPRAVRDISMKVGKQAELVIEGRETLIDKMILEHLYDPMTHLVNNALTHGIESPEVRRAAGKAPTGRITVRAFHQGNQTIISVSDDGAGIDVDRVKVKALEKGLVTPAEAQQMTRLDAYDLLFHAGFSTKDQADDFAGRGVGMDVVRTSLSEIRGVINTDSTMGKGTTFTIRLPLTLSISKALCCISDRARIAFPMDGVEDMLDLPKERIQVDENGQPSIAWRDTILPLHPLTELLGYNRHLSRGNVYGGAQEDDIISVVVLRSAGNYLALQVDNVLGEQEIVIKQLEGPVPKPIGVAGATVLGDGRIMPIADVLELIDLSMGRIRKDSSGALWDQGSPTSTEATVAKTEPMVLIVDDSITVRELLSMTFNKVGYRVEQARDGQEAWEKLRSGLPCDIVFCDIEMPRMDGLELLSRIQKDPNLSSVPIAMLTSRGADRHRQMAASLGASGYFTKPYLEEALLDAAQRMLKGEVLITTNGNT